MTTASVPSLLCKVHVQCTHLLVSKVLQTDWLACISTSSYTASEEALSLAKKILTSFMLSDKGMATLAPDTRSTNLCTTD